MQTPRTGALPRLLATFLLTGVTVACGGSKGDTSEQKAAKTPAVEAKTVDAKAPAADDAPAEGGPAAEESGGSTGPSPATTGTPAGTTGSAAAGDASGSGGTGGAGDSGGGDSGEGTTGAAIDLPGLLKEIKSKRTKDARAQAALTEAEAAGAEPAELAKALNSRGEALFATPERAKVFFEMANEKDPKATSPAFNLAKQSAMVGELDEAKKWLTVVHERKGKKLLKQIDFDPMWDILKDDPDVRALLK